MWRLEGRSWACATACVTQIVAPESLNKARQQNILLRHTVNKEPIIQEILDLSNIFKDWALGNFLSGAWANLGRA